jgi:hypothetical protein
MLHAFWVTMLVGAAEIVIAVVGCALYALVNRR